MPYLQIRSYVFITHHFYGRNTYMRNMPIITERNTAMQQL